MSHGNNEAAGSKAIQLAGMTWLARTAVEGGQCGCQVTLAGLQVAQGVLVLALRIGPALQTAAASAARTAQGSRAALSGPLSE